MKKQNFSGEKIMNMTAKVSQNYDEKTINDIRTTYVSSPLRATVDSLAIKYNKTPRSVIAKLSALGIYQKPEAVTKRGEPIVRKGLYVREIQEALNVDLASLEKMSKADLATLRDALKDCAVIG